MLEPGTQTPSPAPDLIPAENQPRTYTGIGTTDGALQQVEVRLVRIQLAMASMTLCGAMVGTILVSW
jgi:hypothetical protein